MVMNVSRSNRIRIGVLLAAAAAVPLVVWAYATGGPPPFRSGGSFPGESSCAEGGCHALPGRVNTGRGSISISVSPYKPGATQTITITVTDPATTQTRFGFEITARLASNALAQAGSFRSANPSIILFCGDPNRPTNVDPLLACTSNSIQFAGHNSAAIRNNTIGGATFSVDWTAPSTNVGKIIFAAAGNAANGNGSADPGDNVYTTSATVDAATESSPAPLIFAGGVIGAGLSNPAVKTISLNGIISIFGQDFAPAGTVKLISGADLVDGKLPTNFAGLCVQVGNDRARFFHVFPGQLNVQAPTIADRGPVQVRVIQNCDQPNAVQGNIETVTVAERAPEFFFFKQNADGKNPIAAVNALTGAPIGAPELLAGATPAKPGDILALFSTGFGATDPPFQAGVLPDKIAPTTSKVAVTLNGVTLADSDMLYAGVAPGLAGLYQINIRVPANAPDGDLAVAATVAGVSTPAGAFITVKK